MALEIQLNEVTRGDVEAMASWLQNTDIVESWYGTDEGGKPRHIGYSPEEALKWSEEEWERVFANAERKIYSIYETKEGHIGEAQMVIEAALQEAQLFVIVGRKELWFQHYGSAALLQLLGIAFDVYKLHRVWVDVPEYNTHAIHMSERLGFVLEGHLRSTHQKGSRWYDSQIMGLLEDEYRRRGYLS